ncbi:MAG: hypothetical protein OEZ24_00450 [Candidatus Bathyarchaeota archaeon]|nr:hypothetical protein [Candidatus Bathyarchaeota archaeon]
MGKAAFTPLYISVAWTLMIGYQLFTQTAVVTVVESIYRFWPSTTSAWLASRMEIMIFIHAFAWVFVLSSVIPSVLLKKRNSVLIQFFACLMLALIPIWVKDNLHLYTDSQVVEQIFSMSGLFNNPLFAASFLLAPYVLMLSLDIYSRVKERREEEWIQKAEVRW